MTVLGPEGPGSEPTSALTQTSAGTRGRPLDPDLETAIIRATQDLIATTTYPRLRMVDISRRAGVGLGAIYRRWPTKADLIVAALSPSRPPDVDHSTLADPREVLRQYLASFSQVLAGPEGRFVASLMAEFHQDPYLARRVRETLGEPTQRFYRLLIGALLGDVADLDARAAMGPAMILSSTLVAGVPVTLSDIDEIILPLVLGDTR